ncbi:MAG: TetR/AcrR family transcriptional regulator [Peptococcaceae bacterium]|nr:TetR/AcrR family transcriptional regulator [Peptococcaceae bacterium]
MADVREPKQARAIEKKKVIVHAACALYGERGYHQTTTAEIAKAAGVSTGLVYSYFRDKKDILLAVVDRYLEDLSSALQPVFMDDAMQGQSLRRVVENCFDVLLLSHRMQPAAHDEFLALALRDGVVRAKFDDFEEAMLSKLLNLKIDLHITPMQLQLAYGVIEQGCHACLRADDETVQMVKKWTVDGVEAILGIAVEQK